MGSLGLELGAKEEVRSLGLEPGSQGGGGESRVRVGEPRRKWGGPGLELRDQGESGELRIRVGGPRRKWGAQGQGGGGELRVRAGGQEEVGSLGLELRSRSKGEPGVRAGDQGGGSREPGVRAGGQAGGGKPGVRAGVKQEVGHSRLESQGARKR